MNTSSALNLNKIRRLGDIIAFESGAGKWLGYHARNLEIAQISPETWNSFVQPLDNPEAFSQLKNWDQEQNVSVKSGKAKAEVRSLTLNVNQICNLHCAYCAAGGDGTYGEPVVKMAVEKTLPQLRFFLSKLSRTDRFNITFLGGEPLLYLEGLELISEYALKMSKEVGFQISFCIVTNGTLFTEASVALLKKIKCNITISMDGPAEINDVVRPSKNKNQSATAMIEKGLSILLKEKESLGSIGFSGTFGKYNLELKKAWDYYRSWNIDWFEFAYDHKETSAETSQQFTENMIEVADAAFKLGGEHELRKIRYFDNFFNLLDQQQRVENFCGAGRSYLMIDAKNNIYTCQWDVGDKTEQVGVNVQLDSEKLAKYGDSLVEKNNCQSCWARFLCGGGCMYIHKNNTGSKHKVDDNFCNRTKSLILQTLKMYETARS
jgi:uncharacterized protein